MTQVLINDILSADRLIFNYTDNEKAVSDYVWDQEDTLLLGLQKHDEFKGKTKWKDLTPLNFKFMIVLLYEKVFNLSKEERDNIDNEIVKSLDFVIACMIRCIEERIETNVLMLKIDRIQEKMFTYQIITEDQLVFYANSDSPKLKIVDGGLD